MENFFLLTLVLIFVSALVGIYLRRRARDLCLRDFQDFHTTIEIEGGDLLWGRLAVYSRGIELLFAQPHLGTQGHPKTSFVLLGDLLERVQVIYRYHDELSDSNKQRRREEIARTYQPTLLRRWQRNARNLLNTFRDAFNESIGVALSQTKRSGGAALAKSQNVQLSKISQSVLGASAHAYEPLLERYIGKRVVVEELRDGQWMERAGILKDYTADWIELLDCRTRTEHGFPLTDPERLQLNRQIDFFVTREEPDLPGGLPVLSVRVENRGAEPIYLKRVEGPGYSRPVDALAPPGGVASLRCDDLPASFFEGLDADTLPAEVALRAEPVPGEVSIEPDEMPPLPDLKLIVEVAREVDLLLPRSHSVLRHGGSRIPPAGGG
ncbi:MAG: hypothetical protein JRG83_01125 [Deltaproteobacteria bacterium]|nr:hypothetical protein [Deltaproteobacteria bacterium]